MLDFLNSVDSVVWGPFLLIPLLLGTGLWLTVRLRGLQFRKMIVAFRHGLVAVSYTHLTLPTTDVV